MLSKEKNFILFTNVNGRTYRYDFERDIWYSFSGNIIKNAPQGFALELARHRPVNDRKINTILDYLSTKYRSCYSRPSIKELFLRINLPRVDRIINIVNSAELSLTYSQIDNICRYEAHYKLVIDNTRMFLKVLKENPDESISTIMNRINFICLKDMFMLDEQTMALVPKDFVESIKNYLVSNYNYSQNIMEAIKKDKSLFNKIVLWHYKELQHHHRISQNAWLMINDALHYSELLERKLERNNFLKQLIELSRDYTLVKDEMSSKAIRQNLPKNLVFNDDDFTVVLPTSVEDFQKEGENQHNCVASYVDSVAENRTWVVFIRKNNDINKSHITCEINPRTKQISQFLLPYNRTPYADTPEGNFKRKYQAYLYSLN